MRILSNLLAFFFICCSVEGQVSFITECNAKSVSAGSTFTITFRLNNAEGSNFTPPDFKGFEVVNGPMRSMQSSFVNGVGTSSMGFVYTLMATTQGEFTIKPATIIVAGKKLLSTSYTVKVVKQDASKNSSQKEYFILASLDTDNAYIGQQVILIYKLYTSTSIDNIEIVSQPNLDKFSSQNFTLVQEPVITEVYKGKQYNSKLLIKKAIFPLLSGKLKIDPTKFRLTINNDEDPFGFSFSTFGNTKMENISTNSLELQVAELPNPVPSNFSGAVGQFNVLFSTINNTYSLSDAIPVEITISGNGNFSTLKPELFTSDSLFEKSDSRDTEPTLLQDQEQQIFSKKFTYLITPKIEGTHDLKLQFCYFDPIKKEYQNAIKNNTVRISKQGIQFTSNSNSINLEPINTDAVLNSPFLIRNKWTYFLLSFPLLLFAFFKINSANSSRFTKKEKTDNQLSAVTDFPQETKHQLLKAIIKQYPSLDNQSTEYELKEFLRKQSADPISVKFLQAFDHCSKLQYSHSTKEDWLTLQSEIQKITL